MPPCVTISKSPCRKSTPPVEIVKATIGDKGGVRMTGGGFGGCVVALVPEELVPAVRDAVAKQYEAKTGIKETFYVCKASQGAGQC